MLNIQHSMFNVQVDASVINFKFRGALIIFIMYPAAVHTSASVASHTSAAALPWARLRLFGRQSVVAVGKQVVNWTKRWKGFSPVVQRTFGHAFNRNTGTATKNPQKNSKSSWLQFKISYFCHPRIKMAVRFFTVIQRPGNNTLLSSSAG